MKPVSYILFSLLGIILLFPSCKTNPEIRIRTGGPEVVDFRAVKFPLTDVKLKEGPFFHAMELNEKSLLGYESDRLLAKFRMEAGLKPRAEHYHGWEDNTIAGHSLGHYLSGCALMYQSTGNAEFLNRVNYMVGELALCQEADGGGYIGAFPKGKKILEEEVAKGNIRSQGFDLNGIWVPYYTEHKVLMGLMDAYYRCGNKQALEVASRFADWLYTVVKDLDGDQIQMMLRCEHGGMNEALAELYAATGNEKYLEMSRVFHHKAVLDSLAHGKDILPGKHANTQIPKLIGLARRYELTNDSNDRKAAQFFWDRVVHHHSYVTGGNCDHEYFGAPDTLRDRLSDATTETCNVYNMLKLSDHLFEWDARPEVADFYERALFNHILSSQNPDNGRVVYNLSLEMGGLKDFQDPFDFTCCIGTGMENHSKYAENIYYHNDKELFVNQFIASELDWKEKGIHVRQLTQFPEEQNTQFEMECSHPVELTLQIRYPYWALKGISIKVNGKNVRIKQDPCSFVAVRRMWKSGDVVEVDLPFSLRLEAMPDDSNRVAVMFGPMVLAGELGTENDPSTGDPFYVPVIMTENRNPESWTNPEPGSANTFKSVNVGKPTDIHFKPFYKLHDCRYSVYFDLFNQEIWNKYQEDYKAKLEEQKKLENLTIDFFQPGEMQPERDHNLKSNKSWVNEFKRRKSREADRGGWFSCEMKINHNQPFKLGVEYWGGFPGSKTFDIFVDNVLIATENISNAKPGEFFTKIYSIPDNVRIKGTKLTVKFIPKEGHRAGPVFGIRTLSGI
jgi:uncharacterized protein